jgi:hypothetical protein
MIKKFNQYIKEEASPRIPNSDDYWVSKLKKDGKDVMIYTHDDLDGIFSAIAIKKYLISKGFNIIGYGVVNYQEGWKVIDIKKNIINIAVDFAEYHPDIDVYIDHHGDFLEGEDIKKQSAIKTKTGSAYEGIMDVLGLPVDSVILDVIDMVDSAKYDDYGVKWEDLIDFNVSDIIKKPNAKLLFAGAFNQLIKRGDFKTIIEVIHNSTEPSIYQIFNLFKILYPLNNINKFNQPMDFVSSSKWRMDQVKKRTGGISNKKEVINSLRDFIDKYVVKIIDTKTNKPMNIIKLDGYVVIGELVFVGTGTWANAIRARSIIQRDINSGKLPKEAKNIKWIMLQYGDTLQIVSMNKIEEYDDDDLPKTKEGKPINDLKKYCVNVLNKMKINLNFDNSNTIAGGHKGIGSISNIGVSKYIDNPSSNFNGIKYIDIIKNYIIHNLSKVPWSLGLSWENPIEKDNDVFVETPIDARVMYINQIKQVDIKKSKNIYYPSDYEEKDSIQDMIKKEKKLKELQKQVPTFTSTENINNIENVENDVLVEKINNIVQKIIL